jgi:fatty acid synthase
MKPSVIISGVSVRFPESDSLTEFQENLFNGVDMTTLDKRRWPVGLYGMPGRSGKIKDLSKFDAEFFGIPHHEAKVMDHQTRLMLETTFEAIVDAGLLPCDVSGKRTGVFSASFFNETDLGAVSVKESQEFIAYRQHLARHINFVFDITGPSPQHDTACSSSFYAINAAFHYLKTGQLDYAIVVGHNVAVWPGRNVLFDNLSFLSKDGKCAYLDESGSGYVKCEAVCSILLQTEDVKKLQSTGKMMKPLRNYCEIVNIKTNDDGFKEQGITYPSGKLQFQLMKEVYQESGIDPLEVDYVEAHGTGTQAGDTQETASIYEFFCKSSGRTTPLLVGSVKTNMGHAEAVSGLASIVKMIIAFENEQLPPILHLKNINPKLTPVLQGHLKPVTQVTPFKGNLVGINSFGFGGANGHIILKKNPRKEDYKSNFIVNKMDRLILVAGTSKEAVESILDSCQFHWYNKSLSNSYLRILNHYSRLTPENGMTFRGSLIIPSNSSQNNGVIFKRDVRKTPFPAKDHFIQSNSLCSSDFPSKPNIVFLFAGMGCQSRGMFKELIKIDCFHEVMKDASRILDPLLMKSRKKTLHEILFSEDNSVEEDPLLASVSLIVFQCSLMQVLNECGIKQDVVIGHSIGEVVAAYSAGQISLDTVFKLPFGICNATDEAMNRGSIRGGMAAVGLSAANFLHLYSKSFPQVEISCFNTADSVTVGGPEGDIDALIEHLSSRGVFIRKVKSCGIANHAPAMMATARTLMSGHIDNLINDTFFSEPSHGVKWINTTKRNGKRIASTVGISISDYFTNNLTDSVLFDESCQFIPDDSIIIEISPRGFISSLIKKNMMKEKKNFVMIKTLSNNGSLSSLLDLLTDVYVSGIPLDLDPLYDFARSCPSSSPSGMPSLSSLIKLNHQENHLVRLYPEFYNTYSDSGNFINIDINQEKWKFVKGHKIDGRILFPATGYLFVAWELFSKSLGKSVDELDIEMNDVKISRACILSPDKPSQLTVVFSDIQGKGVRFSILDGEATFASGVISNWTASKKRKIDFKVMAESEKNGINLSSSDIYRELRIRGYEYGRSFRSLENVMIPYSSSSEVEGFSEWKGKWISFTDSLLQLSILSPEFDGQRGLFLPTGIQSCKLTMRRLDQTRKNIAIKYDPLLKEVSSESGIVFSGIKVTMAPKKIKTEEDVIEEYSFHPYDDLTVYGKGEKGDRFVYRPLLDVVIENSVDQASDFRVLFIEFNSESSNRLLHDAVTQVHRSLSTTPDLSYKLTVMCETDETGFPANVDFIPFGSKTNSNEVFKHLSEASLVVVIGFITDTDLTKSISNRSFVLLVSEKNRKLDALPFSLISKKIQEKSGTHSLIQFSLMRKTDSVENYGQDVIVDVSSLSYSWIQEIKDASEREEIKRIWLTTNNFENDPNNNFVLKNSTSKIKSPSGILGLLTALRQEPGSIRNKLRCIFDPDSSKMISFKEFEKIRENNLVMNVRVNGVWGCYRHVILTPDFIEENIKCQTDCALLNVKTIGDLSSFSWFKSKLANIIHENIDTNEVICSVNYASLNFKDVMLASGKLPLSSVPSRVKDRSCVIGIEFSGVSVKSGERVMGFLESSSMATHVCVQDNDLLWTVPPKWTLEEAATVPIVYATAYYALIIRGKLQSNESILIHAGSGGVGQASISIALNLGCKVITSVGTNEKRLFLQRKFLELNEESFVDSRSISFYEEVMKRTNGKGVDVVLNSLADEMQKYSILCLNENGRFLEIGKYDLTRNTPLELSTCLSSNQSFHGIFLDEILSVESKHADLPRVILQDKKRLHKLVSQGIKDGVVRPLDTTVFSHEEIEQAFRFMAAGKHVGKVVIKIREESDESNFSPEKRLVVTAVDRLFFSSTKSYVIIGGLGGFALELLSFMIERGARKFILTSRNGVISSHQKYCLQRMKSQAAHMEIVVSKLDASNEDEAREIVFQAESMGKLGGVFNLAMVLSDALFNNQTIESFKKTCEGKVNATMNMDSLTRRSSDLEYFICFSSVSAGRGIAGQSNYAFANSLMERICEERRSLGLPGLAVEWGAVGDVGVLSRKTDEAVLGDDDADDDGVEVRGTKPQRISSCLSWLENFILIHNNRKDASPVFSSFTSSKKDFSKSSSKTSDVKSLVQKVANIIGVRNIEEQMLSNAESITLSHLGIDSLMAVEIKQTIERFLGEESGITFNTQQINQMTVSQLLTFEKEKK